MQIGPDNQHEANQDDIYGFYGAIRINEGLSEDAAAEAFSQAFYLMGEATGENPILLRNFLRSKHGRYLANECGNCAGTLEERIEKAIDSAAGGWINRSLVQLCKDGFEFHLFDDETIED